MTPINPQNNRISEKIAKQVLVCDGATGTNLLQRGLPAGVPSEKWVIDNPDEILHLHQDFLNAGSDIILTCTFGASPLRLQQHGLSEFTEIINKKAVEIAKSAALNSTLIAGSIGPLGVMLSPYGTLSEDEARNHYSLQVSYLLDAGVDLILIETQFDLSEAKIAVEAALSLTDKPIICSFSYDRGIRTMMGIQPKKMAAEFNDCGLFALGINCGKSIEENNNCLKELRENTNLPIWFKPNAGLPQLDETGVPRYSLSPDIMGTSVKDWIGAGANIIGGCCGTSPDHISAIAKQVKTYQLQS